MKRYDSGGMSGRVLVGDRSVVQFRFLLSESDAVLFII